MSSRTTAALEAELHRRIIDPSQFVADASAFVDVHLPRSAGKTSFSFIGPGVTQNELAPTNIAEPHGFCVGAAGLEPGMVNNSHLHYTEEVFVCLTGKWRMIVGLDATQELVIGPGDVFSVPTWLFRAFENVGYAPGLLYTFLGGDDPGGIVWSPKVLRAARETGYVLDEDEKVRRVEELCPDEPVLQPCRMMSSPRSSTTRLRNWNRVWSATPDAGGRNDHSCRACSPSIASVSRRSSATASPNIAGRARRSRTRTASACNGCASSRAHRSVCIASIDQRRCWRWMPASAWRSGLTRRRRARSPRVPSCRCQPAPGETSSISAVNPPKSCSPSAARGGRPSNGPRQSSPRRRTRDGSVMPTVARLPSSSSVAGSADPVSPQRSASGRSAPGLASGELGLDTLTT